MAEVKNTEEITKNKKEITDIFAVIKTGGKQYVVTPGAKLSIEKVEVEEGKKIEFDTLLRGEGEKLEIGQPQLSTKVEAKVLAQAKDDKIIVFKYKKRKNYRKKQGHRQNITRIEITKI